MITLKNLLEGIQQEESLPIRPLGRFSSSCHPGDVSILLCEYSEKQSAKEWQPWRWWVFTNQLWLHPSVMFFVVHDKLLFFCLLIHVYSLGFRKWWIKCVRRQDHRLPPKLGRTFQCHEACENKSHVLSADLQLSTWRPQSFDIFQQISKAVNW